jgi:hypothetical protein
MRVTSLMPYKITDREARQTMRRSALENIHDMFAAVRWVADQTLVLHIDDEIEQFQGDLANQDRQVVGDLADIEGAFAPLDCQPHRGVHWHGNRPTNASRISGAVMPKAKLRDQPLGKQ